jgi:hypothetical protein
MKMRELDSYLRESVESLGEVIVDQDLIEYRNIQVELLPPDGRTLEERMIDADCTLLEYILIQRKLVEKSYDNVHDFCVHEYKIDVKCVNTKYYNIPKEKSRRNIPWMKKAFENNNLTHFAFYHMNRPLRPLEVDDKITFEYLKLESADHVLKNLQESKYDGYYYRVKG